MANGSLGSFLEEARTLIENARDTGDIARTLREYGYDAARFTEGETLLKEADALAKSQALEYGDRKAATADLDASWEAANARYMKALKIARLALAGDNSAGTSLRLYGPRQRTVVGWIDQAGFFYSNLLARPNYVSALGRFGYSRDKLAAEEAMVEGVHEKHKAQAKGTGGAQAATAERDKKLKRLDAWVGELRTVAKVAFHEYPRELEKLGIAVRGSTRHKAKKGETAAASGSK